MVTFKASLYVLKADVMNVLTVSDMLTAKPNEKNVEEEDL
jgi:hypothetical protein